MQNVVGFCIGLAIIPGMASLCLSRWFWSGSFQARGGISQAAIGIGDVYFGPFCQCWVWH